MSQLQLATSHILDWWAAKELFANCHSFCFASAKDLHEHEKNLIYTDRL